MVNAPACALQLVMFKLPHSGSGWSNEALSMLPGVQVEHEGFLHECQQRYSAPGVTTVEERQCWGSIKRLWEFASTASPNNPCGFSHQPLSAYNDWCWLRVAPQTNYSLAQLRPVRGRQPGDAAELVRVRKWVSGQCWPPWQRARRHSWLSKYVQSGAWAGGAARVVGPGGPLGRALPSWFLHSSTARIIVYTRTNVAKMLISEVTSSRRICDDHLYARDATATRVSECRRRVRVAPAQWTRELPQLVCQNTLLHELAASTGRPTLALTYEALQLDKDAQLRRVLRFIGKPPTLPARAADLQARGSWRTAFVTVAPPPPHRHAMIACSAASQVKRTSEDMRRTLLNFNESLGVVHELEAALGIAGRCPLGEMLSTAHPRVFADCGRLPQLDCVPRQSLATRALRWIRGR